jgi:hypothetical protein
MEQVISHRGVITWSVLHWGCNNVCRITSGCNMDFSKWRLEILHEIEYLVFLIILFFLGKTNSSEIHVFRSDQLSLLMCRCLTPQLLSKWIMKKTLKMLVMQLMMTLLYEPKIESPCVVVWKVYKDYVSKYA